MKTILWILMAVAALAYSRAQETLPGLGSGVVVLPVDQLPKKVPLFFSAACGTEVKLSMREVFGVHRLMFRIHQGKPEVLRIGLSGKGEVRGVTGEGLRDWSVRSAEDGSRFLEIRPGAEQEMQEWKVEMVTYGKVEGDVASLLLPTQGAATGFATTVKVEADQGTELRIAKAEGIEPVAGSGGRKFLGTGGTALEFRVSNGASARGVAVLDAQLTGRPAADGGSVSFRLVAKIRSSGAGSATGILGGAAAVSGGVSGDGWHLALRQTDQGAVHDLIAEREGEWEVAVDFVAPLLKKGDWRSLDFRIPGGVIVPVRIEGLDGAVAFDRALPVVPVRDGAGWRGFLPVDGKAVMAWRPAEIVAEGELFFSSTETTDVRVGGGLLRQKTVMDLRVLQGKLPSLAIALDGPGEVLSVSGAPVLGWSVKEADGGRVLQVAFSRPLEGAEKLSIESQSALGGFPVKARALRMVPAGALRHSGWLRVANEGAVRIEVMDASGLIQLAPAQFPGGADEGLRQVFVYRFPSADYGYAVQADQVLPEVAVTEVTVYEIAETDRRIYADLELDIREAPLREWEIEIPADHAVAAVTGAVVADYVVGSEVTAGRRRLKIVFKQPVADRQLVRIRLEKNEAAKAGAWPLVPLGYPGVKSRRGYIGAVAAAGYRLVAGPAAGVAEVPLTFFPKKVGGLQQSFRLKEGNWSVDLTVEALGQSVQADVFHLYSLKAGAAYGSVLMNFFVVGAPATEWRIAVPAAIGNIEVSGQNVGRDWRREGDVVIVPLSRPVLGAGTLLLTFEQPMSARGGGISPGEVRPLNVQGERGYLQVVSPLQVNYDVSRSEGALLALDASELPAEFRLLSSAPTLGAWQYTARDFALGLDIEWFQPGETVGQVVDFLKLASRVSKDGQWVTDARFFVKSKGGNGVRMKLPAGAVLWEARVAGEAVNARKDGGEMLVPLPAGNDPNQAVEVSLRYGARAAEAGRPRLAAPVLEAPVVIGEWTVTGDEGRVLVPKGGNADLTRPVLLPTGWSWLGSNPARVALLLVSMAAMVWLGRAGGFRRWAGAGFAMLSIGLAGAWLLGSGEARTEAAVVEYAAPAVKAGVEVAVEFANVAAWRANTGWTVWLAIGLGLALWLVSKMTRLAMVMPLALGLIAAGVLSIRGGAPWFFAGLILLVIRWWWAALREGWRLTKARPVAHGVASLLLAMGLFYGGEARAAEIKAAESMLHDWRIHDGRLQGTVEVTVRGEAGDRFLLLREPAVLGGFAGQGLKVVKAPLEGGDAYFIEMDTTGKAVGRADFEMPLADPAKGWKLPGGPAVMRQVKVRWDEAGWEFFSPDAARTAVMEGLAANESGAVLILHPTVAAVIQARPRPRDADAMETKFFVEVTNDFLSGPGVVTGTHRISVRLAQGRLRALVMQVPEGFTVSDVTDGPVGSWRFDPGKRELRVALESAQDTAFSLSVGTQRATAALPIELELAPLRVMGAAGEVGMLGLGFGEEAQPETVETEGLSRVNAEDFHVPKEGGALPQHAFRYGTEAARAKVKIRAVSPELRVESWQLVSLGEDRLVMAADFAVTITRAGVFRLLLAVPEGLEVESATGEGLSHWTESGKGTDRVVTLHLAGRTLGARVFSLTLSGPAVAANASWQVPRISLRGASRETGVLTVVPERGLQVRAVERRNVSQLDPRELASGKQEAAKAAARPGALAYRLLQGDWALGLGISRLDPWVTAQVFHEATLREGQVLSRVGIGYKIENSALKTLRVGIPGLDAEAAATVRATGPAVADFVPVAGEEGLWEIRFQRGIAGETKVELEYQSRSKDAGSESIRPVTLEQVRQLSYFTVLRAAGRLEIEAGPLPRGWQRTDWAVVQSSLGTLAGPVAPLIAFRVADPEGPLPVVLKRHDLADLRKLRVSQGTLTSLISARGDALTAAALQLEVAGKGTLRLRLPKGAELFHVRVNEEGANLVREGDEWLFHVFPSPVERRPTIVRFVYSAGAGKGDRLEGPRLNVPMENLSWRVLVPEGWKLSTSRGDFDLKDQVRMGGFRMEDYQSYVRSKRESDSRSAVAMLDQANSWLARGDQERAGAALGNAMRSNLLDDASNEDARVQLRQLRTQQAVLGLNTRRQKLVLDQNPAGADQSQLEQAAGLNPVLRGDVNFTPQDFDRYTAGNTVDENTALKDIANRIVSQQLAAEPAPVALDVTLPERGTVLTFGRSVQVDGDRAMGIDLKLEKDGGGGGWLGLVACAVVALLAVYRAPVMSPTVR